VTQQNRITCNFYRRAAALLKQVTDFAAFSTVA